MPSFLIRLLSYYVHFVRATTFFFLLSPSPFFTLFPYTTLFRSEAPARHVLAPARRRHVAGGQGRAQLQVQLVGDEVHRARSEEHTSELQSRGHLVCRLLLEKKNCMNVLQ